MVLTMPLRDMTQIKFGCVLGDVSQQVLQF